jgi:hypothetical protein
MRALIIAVMLLSACAAQKEGVTGDAEGVWVKAGFYVNPVPVAEEHCASYGKRAILSGQSGDYFTFDCVVYSTSTIAARVRTDTPGG